MERLFSPCTRLYDILENRRPEELRGHHKLYRELNLDVSTEELLSAERALTYADLYAMLGNGDTTAWLTPHAAVVRVDRRSLVYFYHVHLDYRFDFKVDGQLISASARSLEALSEIFDVVRGLLLANAREVYELEFRSAGLSAGKVFSTLLALRLWRSGASI
jgi:hypothetical protein